MFRKRNSNSAEANTRVMTTGGNSLFSSKQHDAAHFASNEHHGAAFLAGSA